MNNLAAVIENNPVGGVVESIEVLGGEQPKKNLDALLPHHLPSK